MQWNQLIAAFDQLWRQTARARSAALCDESRSYSYAELHHAVGGCASWLRAQGVESGDRIAIAMERSAQMVIVILGAMAAGACPCPLEPMLGGEELRRRIAAGGIGCMVMDEAHRSTGTLSGLPSSRCLLHTCGVQEGQGTWRVDLDPLSDSFLLFTSGSSGAPKGVLQNHRGMLINALGVSRRTELDEHDTLLHIMPLHHTNGINNQLLAPFLSGSRVVLASRFRAEDMPALFERHQPTIVTGVPTMYSRMLPLDFPERSLQKLRMLRCGSAPITEELHRRVEAKFGLPLVVSYGLSEATCTSTMNPPRGRRIGSVGTPLGGQSVFLRGAQGEPLSRPGAEGEICIAGPSLMTGYLLNAASELEPVGETLRTGDLGRFDEDGYLYITGRLKEVIIRGGENLSPNLIEEAIATVPGIAACCVVGKTHADLGEVPVAFVVPREKAASGEAALFDAISRTVNVRLSRIHCPTEVFFMRSLPENATGKVDRKKLRMLASS